MENKNVGMLIMGIAVVMGILIFIFNNVLYDNIGLTCSHANCEMYDSLRVQTYISLSVVAIILIIGLIIMFSKPKEKIIFKKVREAKRKIDLAKLDRDEKRVMEVLLKENAIFQSSLMEKLEIGKVGMTRLLDKLEAKQLIERKRRGMNNVVVLKH